MPQYDDLQGLRNRSSNEKICKRSDELKDLHKTQNVTIQDTIGYAQWQCYENILPQ